MLKSKPIVGFELQKNQLLIVIKKDRKKQDYDFYRLNFKEDILQDGHILSNKNIENDCKNLLSILPKKSSNRLVISSQLIWHKKIKHPKLQLNFFDKKLYIEGVFDEFFPQHKEEFYFDFFSIDAETDFIFAIKKQNINLWQDFFAKFNVFFNVIDIYPCLLFFLANFFSIPLNIPILHQENSDWLIMLRNQTSFDFMLTKENLLFESISEFSSENTLITNKDILHFSDFNPKSWMFFIHQHKLFSSFSNEFSSDFLIPFALVEQNYHEFR